MATLAGGDYGHPFEQPHCREHPTGCPGYGTPDPQFPTTRIVHDDFLDRVAAAVAGATFDAALEAATTPDRRGVNPNR
jgi:hypothetical protein